LELLRAWGQIPIVKPWSLAEVSPRGLPLSRLRDFVDANYIGEPPLFASSDVAEYLLNGITKSAKNTGSRFVVPWKNVVIEEIIFLVLQ